MLNFIHWYDWITPTNPYAASFFGILITILASVSIWYETKNKKTLLVAASSGTVTTVIIVILLIESGFYK